MADPLFARPGPEETRALRHLPLAAAALPLLAPPCCMQPALTIDVLTCTCSCIAGALWRRARRARAARSSTITASCSDHATDAPSRGGPGRARAAPARFSARDRGVLAAGRVPLPQRPPTSRRRRRRGHHPRLHNEPALWLYRFEIVSLKNLSYEMKSLQKASTATSPPIFYEDHPRRNEKASTATSLSLSRRIILPKMKRQALPRHRRFLGGSSSQE